MPSLKKMQQVSIRVAFHMNEQREKYAQGTPVEIQALGLDLISFLEPE